MSERQAAKLFQGITGIDDDIIEEAQTAPPTKKAPIWRRWGMIAACLCLAALAGTWAWRSTGTADSPHTPNGPGTGLDGGFYGNSGCSLPGRISPALRVGGALYQWAGMSQKLFLDPSGSFSANADGSTYLPEGFQPCGDISGITLDTPTEELQLQAGFGASGTVFVNKDFPAVVYVLMSTDWFEGRYVRFVSDALGGNELLTWQGRIYRLSVSCDVCSVLEELPEGCELIGNLHFVGNDTIPSGDLETNNMSDAYVKPFEGREVYAIPGDDSTLYVYEHQYWAEGDYSAWRECHLWEP